MVATMFSKIKEFMKRYLCGFLIGGILFGSISVKAMNEFYSNDVTYNNNSSGLVSTNVKSAIDELYNKCK